MMMTLLTSCNGMVVVMTGPSPMQSIGGGAGGPHRVLESSGPVATGTHSIPDPAENFGLFNRWVEPRRIGYSYTSPPLIKSISAEGGRRPPVPLQLMSSWLPDVWGCS